jgi:hypothetical protein
MAVSGWLTCEWAGRLPVNAMMVSPVVLRYFLVVLGVARFLGVMLRGAHQGLGLWFSYVGRCDAIGE